MTPQSPAAPHDHGPAHHHAVHISAQLIAPASTTRSVLAWPAWLRVLAVLPVVLALWLAVWWANAGVVAW
ncbi:hypothetical protein [Rhodoferax sp.]|uniref:hypothetical protein n=1 Tax=Rhodoferax sp. TaxID=50421 RepID=UPI00261EBE66|nr:hypothetical protein [Rhodoferax sp.]MDD2919148.1 hypothetical protein [Rhodoferax sp.]